MDGGAQTPSTRSSSTSTPQAASPRGTRDVSSPVSIAGGKESEELPNNQSGSSGGMLHQLAADLQQYEAKTSRFFRSLLPGGRTNEKIVRERTMTPKGSDEDDEDGDDALHTEQEHDDHSDDSELYSDDSQNLHGFESTIEGDQVVVNSEDDGEAASSASSSGVFRAYTDRRMAMILNSKAVTASFGGATTDGVIPSSDGEGIAVHAQQQQRVRSRSIDSKHLSAKGGSGAKGHRRSQSIGSVGGSIVAREQQRITSLENALQSTPPKPTTSGKPVSPAPQRAAVTTSGGTAAPLSTASLHYATLDRKRLAAVLRVAKDDQARAVRLAQSYSQLLDRLGLGQTCFDDMKDFATCGALCVFLPTQKEVVVASPQPPQLFVNSATLPPPPPTSRAENSAIVRSQHPVTKDGSRLLTIDVRKLPAVPTSGGPAAKKQFATNLIRYLLYVLEEVRFHSLDGIGVLPTTTTGADGGEALSAGSKPIEPFESEQPRRESGSVATTATVAPTGPTKKTKTKKMLGASATRRIGAIGTSTEDCYTILIDVGGCDSSALSALTVVLSEGEELLCQAYPLSIVRVVVHQGLIVSHPASISSSELPTASTDNVSIKSPPMTAKKAPVLSVFTSLFKSKSATTTKSGTAAADAKTSAPPPLSTPSFASKVWLSVSFSTWKLRFLHHTVRSRTVLADKLDPFVHVDALLLSLQ